MSPALITFKQTITLRRGLRMSIPEVRRIYSALVDTMKSIEEYQSSSNIYTSVSGETNVGDINADSLDELLTEIATRKLVIKSLRMYLNFGGMPVHNRYSYTIDAYIGSLNQINLVGSNEKWVLDSKDRLEYATNKIPVLPKKLKPGFFRALEFIFNGRILAGSWVMVIFSLLFSRFYPNIYYSLIASLIAAYAVIGVVVQASINTDTLNPPAIFITGDEEDTTEKMQTITYVKKQPIIVRIGLVISGVVVFISALMQILDIARRFNWIR